MPSGAPCELLIAVDYLDVLRRLTINDARLGTDLAAGDDSMANSVLDAKTLALVRIAALVAISGAVPSFGAHADDAVTAGATPAELVDVLVAVVPIVGLPRVVASAPNLGLALGYDTDDSLA